MKIKFKKVETAEDHIFSMFPVLMYEHIKNCDKEIIFGIFYWFWEIKF